MSEKAAIDAAIQANKNHQYALNVYIERLEAELKTVDRLIAAIDSDDDADDIPDMRLVSVEGATKPVSVLLPRALLSEDSPFFEDAQWRKRYLDFTTVNQMKAKEHDALREAVRIENMRMLTLDAQSRHQPIDIKAFPPEHFEQNAEGIDWRRVSIKMSSSIPSAVARTPRECQIRWLGHLHPSINQSSWTPEETKRLRAILDEDSIKKSPVDWTDIAKRLGTNRTPIDCMRHGMTRKVHTWSPEADQKLLDAVELYGQNNWQLVAMNVSEDATGHQCQKRYFDSLDPALKFGPWTPEEDDKLRRAIAAFSSTPIASVSGSGENTASGKQTIPWQDVALFVPGRTNNQCREHFQNRDSKFRSKDKNRQGKGNSNTKRKGKEKATVADGLNEEEEDEGVASDAAEQGGAAETSTAGKRKAKPKRGAPSRGKRKGTRADLNSEGGVDDENHSDLNADSATLPQLDSGLTQIGVAEGESLHVHDTKSAPRALPGPRPRPRRKVGSAVESSVVEEETEPSAQSEPTAEETGVSSNLGNSGSASKPKSSPRRKGARIRTGTGAMRRRNAGLTNIKDTEQASGKIIGDTADGPEESTVAEPANKKRRTAGRPKSGMGTSMEDSLAVGTTDTAELSGKTRALLVPHEGDDGAGRRRSSRLAKGKS